MVQLLAHAGWPMIEKSVPYRRVKAGGAEKPAIWKLSVATADELFTAKDPKSRDDKTGETVAALVAGLQNRIVQTSASQGRHFTRYISAVAD